MEAGVAPTASQSPALVSVEISSESAILLRELAALRGVTTSQALAQALIDDKFFRDQVLGGYKVLLQAQNGSVSIVNLP